MIRLVLARTLHPLHVHHVHSLGVLFLTEFEHFEFLAHGRVSICVVDGAECAQRLLGHAVFFRVREALVLFNLRDSLFLFEAELNIVDGVVGQTDQVRCDREAELAEVDLGVRLVAQSAQDRMHVLLQNLLLKLEEEVLDVLEVEIAEVTLVDDGEERDCVEFVHGLQRLLLYLHLDVIVDLFFEEA